MKYTTKLTLEDKFITIYFFNNKEQYEKFTNLEINKYITGNAYCNYDERIIAIGVFDSKLSTLTHELYHSMEYINDLICEDNNALIYFSEANAYLIGYLFSKFEKLIHKNNKKSTK